MTSKITELSINMWNQLRTLGPNRVWCFYMVMGLYLSQGNWQPVIECSKKASNLLLPPYLNKKGYFKKRGIFNDALRSNRNVEIGRNNQIIVNLNQPRRNRMDIFIGKKNGARVIEYYSSLSQWFYKFTHSKNRASTAHY